MKKLNFLFLILSVISVNAQFTITKVGTTTQIFNNDVLTFNSVGNNSASLKFHINNTTASDIFIKIQCVSITGANGSGMEFCFAGSCISDVNAGVNYPTDSPFYTTIPAMSNNGDFDHFKNYNAGNGSTTQNYVFKFFQVNAAGIEIGTPITMTYRYQPAAMSTNGFDSLENLGIQLNSNSVDNELNVKTIDAVKMELYDINGRLILYNNLISGDNNIDFSGFQPSIYILKFYDDKGKNANIKIVKN